MFYLLEQTRTIKGYELENVQEIRKYSDNEAVFLETRSRSDKAKATKFNFCD